MAQASGGPGYGSAVIAGQRVPVQTRGAWFPVAFGASRQVSATPMPTVPPAIGSQQSIAPVGGGNGGPANTQAAAAAGQNPWDARISPTWWSIAFLVIGLVGLRVVHWRHG